jgi:Cupin domain
MSNKLERRLVVTGHDDKGRSQLSSDTVVRGEELPGQFGFECSVIWGSDQKMHFPDKGARPPFSTFFPPLDGFRLIECYMPPHYRPEADISSKGEYAAAIDNVMPGITDTMVEGRPGMHRTATVDLIVLLEGRCVLQLDNEVVKLNTGDLLIESGTIHAWTNPYDEPCRFLCAVVGAKNDLCS